jgi:proteic killer suppression protein
VDVGANWRLIFEAYDENEQLTTDEGQAKLLSIVSGEDYH